MKQLITIFSIFFTVNSMNSQCWQTISGSAGQSVAIQNDGTAWVWGLNTNSPTLTNNENNWLTLSEGWNQTNQTAIKTDGTLWNWQNAFTNSVQFGTDNWSKLTQGFNYTLAIKENGSLWSWGSNNLYGVQGNGSTTANIIPTQIGNELWVNVVAGFNHVAGIKIDGTLWTWGRNIRRQLGDGTTDDQWSPVQVGTENDWAYAVVGSNFTLALKTNGTLWVWGANYLLANGAVEDSSTPVQVNPVSGWRAITAGSFSAAAIKSDGTMWTWGLNTNGVLGNGTLSTHAFLPIQVGGDVDWEKVDSGKDYVLALKSDGSLWAWGYNVNGALGDGTLITRTEPVLIQCPNLGVLSASNQNQPSISPNPVSEILNINTTLNLIKIRISDLTGKIIYSFEGNPSYINVSALSKGMYIIQMETDNQTFQRKFFKS